MATTSMLGGITGQHFCTLVFDFTVQFLIFIREFRGTFSGNRFDISQVKIMTARSVRVLLCVGFNTAGKQPSAI
jgi:hypothetical protein